MIDFENVWLPQIVSYAEMISTGHLEDQWLGGAPVTTSVTDPDELHEQVFDDLDADGIWPVAQAAGKVSALAADAIESFLVALREVDEREAAILVPSDAWSKVKEAASAVVANVR